MKTFILIFIFEYFFVHLYNENLNLNMIMKEKTIKNQILAFKYDFEKNRIPMYSKKIENIEQTIRKTEAVDVSSLTEFFRKVKESGLPICFFGAGGAASPASFATQLATEEGMVAKTLTPMEVMNLPESVVEKMCFMAISASGSPSDMQAAVRYLLDISPENTYCLTAVALDHMGRYGRPGNPVGKMVAATNSEHAVCIELSLHKDGFIGINKHIGLALLLYRALHSNETGLTEKLLLPDVEPFEARLPDGMTMTDISDLHILYGALGASAATDMEGRMLEAGVMPAIPTDLKNFTHGRHVFLDKHKNSTLLMLLSPKDEKFAAEMMKLIPKDRPAIFIRTSRTDLLGALQLMICTFYLSIDICAPREINVFKPGVTDWGKKLWSLKLE